MALLDFQGGGLFNGLPSNRVLPGEDPMEALARLMAPQLSPFTPVPRQPPPLADNAQPITGPLPGYGYLYNSPALNPMVPQNQPPPLPAPINIPQMKVAEPSTDVSTRTRAPMGSPPGSPPSVSPVAAPSLSPGEIGFGDRINAGLGSFSGAPTLGGAILGGLTGLITGQRNDPYGVAQQNQQLTANALYQGLQANGMDRRQAAGIAMAAATNPELAKAILPQALGPKEPPKTIEEAIARQVDAQIRKGGTNGIPANYMQIYNDFIRNKQAAEKQGQVQGEAAANLPTALQRGQDALTQIDELLKHPGFDRVFGLVGAFPNIPGGQAAGAQARLNQVKGQAFLDAYQLLRGGGAITEIEGAKATAAKARLDAAQSPEEARIALQDLANAVRTGMQKLRETAGQSPQTAPVNNGGWQNVAPGIRIRERQ